LTSRKEGDVLTNTALTEDKAVLSYHLLLQRKRKVYVSQLLIDNGSAYLDDQSRNAIDASIVEDTMTAEMIRTHM